MGASATQHVVQNLVRDTTRDEDVRVNFFFFFHSAFCVALGNPGVLVHQQIAWSDQMLIYETIAHDQVYSFRGILVHSSSERALKKTRGSGVAVNMVHCGSG